MVRIQGTRMNKTDNKPMSETVSLNELHVKLVYKALRDKIDKYLEPWSKK